MAGAVSTNPFAREWNERAGTIVHLVWVDDEVNHVDVWLARLGLRGVPGLWEELGDAAVDLHALPGRGGGPTAEIVTGMVSVAGGVASNAVYARLRAWSDARMDEAARHERELDQAEAEAVARWHIAATKSLSAADEAGLRLVAQEQRSGASGFEFADADGRRYFVEVRTKGGWAVITRSAVSSRDMGVGHRTPRMS